MDNDIFEDLNDNFFDTIGHVLMLSSPLSEAPAPPLPPPEPPILISDICFPKHTIIHTDQGEIMISKINTKIHTIHNKKIKAITKTISSDDYLVCFEKHSIDFNYPSKQTIMSKNHKIKYNGKLMEAHTFLEKNKTTIYKINYTGEVLYNVLMEEYTTIKVNNLLCETLDPNSMIAIIYNNLDKNYIYKLKPYIPPKPSKKMNIKYLK